MTSLLSKVRFPKRVISELYISMSKSLLFSTEKKVFVIVISGISDRLINR